MNKFISYLIVFICVISVIAFFSKPEDSVCREETISKLKSEVKSKLDITTLGNLANTLFSNSLKIEDRILYKEVTLTFDNNTKTVAYGVFWNVFLK